MNFHVLTLFPDMIEAGLHTSVTGRALKNGYIHLSAVNIRDYSKDKHKHVDDYPYGGGAGMVMQPEPIYLAYEDVTQNMEKKPRVVYVTPQGSVFNQSMAEEFSKEEDLIFLCGHYEGVERFKLCRFLIIKDTRYKTGNRINHNHCRKFSPRKHIVTDRHIVCNDFFQNSLIYSLIMPT